MEEIQSFPNWLEEDVQKALQEGHVVAKDVRDSSKLPSMEAKSFKSMYAYGYHFRVKSAEQRSSRTCDPGVAATFRQPCRSRRRDQNVVIENLEYIGELEEIVELNYGGHCVVLLVCDWIKANYRGKNATMKKDEWGFTMANFRALVPSGYESFAFPIHCQQVFFSHDEDEPDWKVVLRTEVRGHRVDVTAQEEEEPEMFAMGRDADFEGPQVPFDVEENNASACPRGRDLEFNELFENYVNESTAMFDTDLGESSEDE